jgi:ADP-ribosylglycohydrolase
VSSPCAKGEKEIKPAVVKSMQKWGRKYPDAGYGGRFIGWLAERNPKPYGSWGNGSAMRVSAVGWLYETIERTPPFKLEKKQHR